MPIRKSFAEWKGTLKDGGGTVRLGSGVYEGPYTWASRFASGPETNPEELVGAAHAGCYSMFLSALLTDAGFTPTSIRTTARVHLDKVPTIVLVELDTEATVPGIDEDAFLAHAEAAKRDCPVSKALTGPEVRLTARLVG